MEQERESFEEVRTRLEEIVDEVNAEDISLDDALKLYEEAVKLGLSACELSESDLFPQEEVVSEDTAVEVDEAADGSNVASSESFESAHEASDIVEASAIEQYGDEASVQFPEPIESVEQTEVEDDGRATYPR